MFKRTEDDDGESGWRRTYHSWIKMRTTRHALTPPKRLTPSERERKIASILRTHILNEGLDPKEDVDRGVMMDGLRNIIDEWELDEPPWDLLHHLWCCGLISKRGYDRYGRPRNVAWRLTI